MNTLTQRKILLVSPHDDLYFAIKKLSQDIQSCNAQLEHVSNFDAALSSIANAEHDAYLFDNDIDGNNGTTLIKTALAQGCTAPCILLTNHTDADTNSTAIHAGATHCIKKDALSASLLEYIIHHAISERNEKLNLQHLLGNIERAKREWEVTVDALPQFICLLDENQQIIRANRIVETWSLGSVKNVAGKNIHQLFHPNCIDQKCTLRMFWHDADDLLTRNQSIAQEVTDPYSGKVLYHQIIPLISNVDSTQTETPHGRRQVAIISDITQQKKLEKQLLQSQKMQAIGQLAGGIAHDFNNLLTAIIGYSQFIGDNVSKDSLIYNDIIEIQKAGKRAAMLTGQLLAFGRRQLLTPKILNLNKLLFEMENLLKRLVGENIDLHILPAQTLGKIKADPSQIEQVIINLVINAKDAMPNGGDITLKTENLVINEDFVYDHQDFPPGHYVSCNIIDTGIGMEQKIIDHIFEPFFTTKKMASGTGLGLSTVYGIVNQSGGYIDVTSHPDEGSTFTLYFPRVDVEPATTKHVSNTNTTSSINDKGTILIAEDDKMVRLLIELVLTRVGYNVLSAQDGDEAIAICESVKKPIDFLITDVIMPGSINGLQLSEKLQKKHPKLKSIFMSGHMSNVMVQQLTLSPNLPFLQKPFSPHDLLKILQNLH